MFISLLYFVFRLCSQIQMFTVLCKLRFQRELVAFVSFATELMAFVSFEKGEAKVFQRPLGVCIEGS